MLEKFAAQSLVEHDGELIFSKEKFAELIIQECCNTILEFDYNFCTSPNKAMLCAVEDIRKHFGVE